MSYRNLREFVAALEQCSELVRIQASVDPELEITEITDRVSKGPEVKNKAWLFENVKGSWLPVLINAFGNARRTAMALNVATLDELSANLAAVIDLNLPKGLGAALNRAGDMLGVPAAIGLKPKIVRRAPCQDIVISEGAQLDRALAELPILKCWPLDGGRYIHTGFYTPADAFPVFHVTAGSRRSDAIYPATVVGKPRMEDYWVGKATERLFLPLLRLFLGEAVDYKHAGGRRLSQPGHRLDSQTLPRSPARLAD